MENYSAYILAKGEKFHNVSKWLMIILASSVVLLLLTIWLAIQIEGPRSIWELLTCHVHQKYTFTVPIILAEYAGLIVGSWGPILYFYSLHLIGLGQIAVNTSKESFKD